MSENVFGWHKKIPFEGPVWVLLMRVPLVYLGELSANFLEQTEQEEQVAWNITLCDKFFHNHYVITVKSYQGKAA